MGDDHKIDLTITATEHRLVCHTCGWRWRSTAKRPDVTGALLLHRKQFKDQSHG